MLLKVFFVALAAPLLAAPPLHFFGTIRAGETFRKPIGSGLSFVLAPVDRATDWTIEIWPADSSDNYVRCVTQPLHGPTAADILAWQLVNDQNDRLPESELSGLKERELQFAVTAADQKQACRQMDTLAEAGADAPGYHALRLGRIHFIMKSFRLSHTGAGKQATLDSLDFDAEITFPSIKR